MQRSIWAFQTSFALLALTCCYGSGYAFAKDDKLPQEDIDPNIPRVDVPGERLPPWQPSLPPIYQPDVPMLDHIGVGSGGGGVSNDKKQKGTSDFNTSIDSCGGDGNPSTDYPVILATGEKYKIENDIVANGKYGMGLDRTYRSFSTVGRMFGTGWSSTYDYPTLQISGCLKNTDYPNQCFPSSITMGLPDGSKYTYTSTPTIGEYKVKNSAALGTMSYSPGQSYTVSIGTKFYIYSATTRAIQSITGPGGAVLISFTYGGPYPNLPTKVSNGAGHYISFTYSNGSVSTATDQDGNQWQYGYTNVNLLTSVTSPGASPDVRKYFYESPYAYYLLTGIAINDVRYSTYSYDSSKRVVNSSLASGEVSDSFTYGTNSTTLTNALGEVSTYNFAPVQGALKVTSISRANSSTCPGSMASTTYDANGWVNSKTDWNGNATNYKYDATGKLMQMTTAAGTSVALTQVNTWTGNNLASTTYQDANGNSYLKATYTYVSSGYGKDNVESETWNDLIKNTQRQISYAYAFQSNGTLASMTVRQALPAGSATTTYSYDTAGNLTSVTNPLGQQISYSEYNGRGFPGTITDPNGITTTLVWDERSNLKSSTLNAPSGPLTTSYVYNHARQPLSISYPDGHVTRYQYNAALRVEYVGNAIGEFSQRAFDVNANTWTTSSDRKIPSLNGSTPVGNMVGKFVNVSKMDSLGRMLVRQGNNGQSIKYTYDNNGNVKTITDAQKHITSMDYDALDRVVKKTLPDGGVIIYNYDGQGNVKSITDPRGLVTIYTYDAFGKVLTITSPDTKLTTYTYDNFGHLLSESKANGNIVVYTWDVLGRVRSRAHGNVVQYFNYDEGLYGIGRLTSFTDGTGETRYGYNAIGKLIKQTNTVLGQVFNISWEYDAVGQLRRMSYPTGIVLHYDYDQYGRLSNVRSINSLDDNVRH